jgi:hypothetical protein
VSYCYLVLDVMDLRPDQCGGVSKLAVPCITAEYPAGVRGREKERSAVGFGPLKVSGVRGVAKDTAAASKRFGMARRRAAGVRGWEKETLKLILGWLGTR